MYEHWEKCLRLTCDSLNDKSLQIVGSISLLKSRKIAAEDGVLNG